MESIKYVVLSGSFLEKIRESNPKLYSHARHGCRLKTPLSSKPTFEFMDGDFASGYIKELKVNPPNGKSIILKDLKISFEDFHKIFVDVYLYEEKISGHKFQWRLKELISQYVELETDRNMCMQMYGVSSQQFKDSIKRLKPVKQELMRVISTIGAVK